MRTLIYLMEKLKIYCPACGHQVLLEDCCTNAEEVIRDQVDFWNYREYQQREDKKKAEEEARKNMEHEDDVPF